MTASQEPTAQEACCHSHDIMDVAAAVANEPDRERELHADLEQREARVRELEEALRVDDEWAAESLLGEGEDQRYALRKILERHAVLKGAS